MGKNLTSIPGTSGPSHPLQSTIQPILGVLEQFWPKKLAEQANPTASLRCERPVGRWRAVGATGSWMPVPGSLDPLTSTTEELCGCLGRGSTGPSSRRAGRGPGHKTRVAAPAGEPGASHKGRLGGRLRQQWQKQACRGRWQALSRWTGIAPECSCGARAALAAVPSAGSVLE